jgi:hypothetical protein
MSPSEDGGDGSGGSLGTGGSTSAGKGGKGGSKSAGAMICTPDATETCQGTDGCEGERTCSGDGYEWSSCACNEVPLEDWGAELAAAECRLLEKCLPEVAEARDNLCDWYTVILGDMLGPVVAEAAAFEEFVYDGKQARRCFDAMAAATCGEELNLDDCADFGLRGSQAVGEPCNTPWSCESRNCIADDQCPGTCGPAKPKLGESCTGPETCAGGLACVAGVCTAASLGEACYAGAGGDWVGCRGAYAACHRQEGADQGTCALVSDIYSADMAEACSNEWLCRPGLSCVVPNRKVGVCRPGVASGAACQNATPSQCPEGEFCDPGDPPAVTGTCKPRLGVGEPCSNTSVFDLSSSARIDSLEGPCAEGLRCAEYFCRKAQPVGEACQDEHDCLSTTCVDGVCQPFAGGCLAFFGG